MIKWAEDALEDVLRIPEHLLLKIEKVGVFTGSIVFGGYVEDESDIDIIIFKDDFDIQLLFDLDYGVGVGENYIEGKFDCVYVKTEEDLILNLILVDSVFNFNAMVKTTNVLKGIKEDGNGDIFKTKKARCTMFQLVLSILMDEEY